jgi:hypothetical protein
MAIINKTGITSGGTIQAEHVTRAIDALSGGSADTIVATGSFSGSLTGIATSASFATTASFALNASDGAGFPFTGSARITGSLAVTGPVNITGPVSTLMVSGAFENMVSVKNTLVTYGDIVYGNTSDAVKVGNIVSLDYATNKWLPVSQSSYDSNRLPVLGTALNISTAGQVMLSGYVTAYKSGSNNGAGIEIVEDDIIRVGNSIFLRESDTGVTSDTIPAGGEIIQVGHIIHIGSAFSTNYVIRFEPKWIKTI